MFSRALFVACAVLLTAWATAVVTSTPAAAAKDDAEKKKADRDALKKELKDKKYFVYFDLSFYVDAPKLNETRWDWKDPPPFDHLDEKQGGQFMAQWVPTAGGEWGIDVKVQKWPHYAMQGSQKQVFNHAFKSWGQSVVVSKIDDIAKGFYEDWLAESTEPIKDHCHEPKKGVKAGPSDWYATAVATDKELKKRVRKDWYIWGTTGKGIPCTWIAEFTITDKFKDTEEVLAIAKALMVQTKEIKDKRAED